MIIKYEDWTEDANCRDIEDPDIFFPPRDKELYSSIAAQAKSYCLGEAGLPACPVRAQCLMSAIKEDEVHGIWGGMSHRERNALVRKWTKSFKDKMSLEAYVVDVTQKGETNGSRNFGPEEVPRR